MRRVRLATFLLDPVDISMLRPNQAVSALASSGYPLPLSALAATRERPIFSPPGVCRSAR
jgi:hypothetical protein